LVGFALLALLKSKKLKSELPTVPGHIGWPFTFIHTSCPTQNYSGSLLSSSLLFKLEFESCLTKFVFSFRLGLIIKFILIYYFYQYQAKAAILNNCNIILTANFKFSKLTLKILEAFPH